MNLSAGTVASAREGYDRLARVYDRLADIDPDDLRDALLAITEGAPLQRSIRDVEDPGDKLPIGVGGRVEIQDLPDHERLVGQNNQLPVHFLEEGMHAQRAVARVQLKQSFNGLPAGAGWGTGSLVSPSLLLTNHHVIPDRAFAGRVAAELNYQFDTGGTARTSDAFDLDPDSFFHTNSALDYTVVRVKPKGPIPFPRRTPGSRWGWLRLPAGSLAYATGQLLNAVGHPSGRRKEIALQENTITGVFDNVIRFTTDTEPASSGSPVFTNGWDIVALHHAGGDKVNGVWINNEAMRIDRIVADIGAHVPAAIKTELGI